MFCITWNDHEGSVGYDEHLHGAHSPTGRKNAAVCDEVDDDLGVEERAEPHSRDDVENDHGVDQPGKLHSRSQVVNGLALNHSKGRSGRNTQQRNKQRYRAEHVFGPSRPQRHHRPRLVHKRHIINRHKQHRKDGTSNALAIRPGRDARVVVAPDGVKVGKGRFKVQREQDGADDADEQAQEVQQVGGAEELGGGRGEEHDEEHGDGGAELGAVVEDDVDGFVVELVDDGDGDLEGRAGGGNADGGVLGGRVEVGH